MPLFVTPRQLSQRAELYQQLSQLSAAGLGIPQAVEVLHRSPPSRSFRPHLALITRKLNEGATFHHALLATGQWLPPFDTALLHAGEQSGRLPDSFQLLASHYETSAALLRKTLSSLGYPALLFHMAVLIGPLPDFFRDWNLFDYIAKTFGIFIPVYTVIGLLLYATQGQHGEHWRGIIESIAHRIPLVGSARRSLANARLSSALEALINAGVTIIEAWELASDASGSPALRKAVHAWKPRLLDGVTPAEELRDTPEFPELFTNLYQTGEVTGSLDVTLRRLHRLYQDQGERQLRTVAEWTPKIVYFGIVIMVAWRVISFWSGYFDQINRTINF